MSWAGSSLLDVYLGTRRAAICSDDKDLWTEANASVDESLKSVRTRLKNSPSMRRLRLWLSGGLCRPFLLPAIDKVRGLEEVRRIAKVMAPSATGLQGPCDVWVEPRGQSAGVAVAISSGVLERLNNLPAECRCKIVAIRPWWAEALRATLAHAPATAAVSVQDCDSVTLLLGQAREFDVAMTVAPILDAESARTAFSRASLSSSVEVKDAVCMRLTLGVATGHTPFGILAFESFVELVR